MTDLSLWQEIPKIIVNAVPAAILIIDPNHYISHIYISKIPQNRLKYLVNKPLSRILQRLFSKDMGKTILDYYTQAILENTPVTCANFSYIDIRGMSYYYNFCIKHILQHNSTIIYIQDITEEVLITEEFSSMSQEYETVNREFCVAMSKLDFHLMDIEQAHKKVTALYKITSIVQNTVNEKEVIEEVLDGITRELGFPDISIMLLDESKQQLVTKAYRGNFNSNSTIPVGQGIPGLAVVNRELTYADHNSSNENNHDQLDSGYLNIGEVAVPLIVNDSVLGVLNIGTSSMRLLQAYDLDLLRSLASSIAMSIAHAKYVAAVEFQAITDELTGLYNYRYFRAALEKEFKRVVRYNRPLSMLMADIDHFKHYNDTNGHVNGNKALKMVAQLLKDNCREIDYVIRYGGEEFAVLLPETDLTEAYNLAERMRASVAEYSFLNREAQPNGALTISIGISAYPDNASTDIELINKADAALYFAKRTRNSVCLYTDTEQTDGSSAINRTHN